MTCARRRQGASLPSAPATRGRRAWTPAACTVTSESCPTAREHSSARERPWIDLLTNLGVPFHVATGVPFSVAISTHAPRCAGRRCARRRPGRPARPMFGWPGPTTRTPEPEPPAYAPDEVSDRIAVLDGAAASACDEGGGFAQQGPADGVQAAGHGAAAVAPAERGAPAPLVRSGVRFVDGLPQARGGTEREARKGPPDHSRSTTLDNISRASCLARRVNSVLAGKVETVCHGSSCPPARMRGGW